MDEARKIVERLGLVPLLPEGGFVRQTHLDGTSSAIYYLMEADNVSGLHRLEHVEIWAWHAGSPASMLLIDPDGIVSEPVLGPDVASGQQPQIVVPHGTWQAAEPLGAWTLVTTVVSPPYSDAIVTFARAADFEAVDPSHRARVRRLCRF
jgi:hypothetical protein